MSKKNTQSKFGAVPWPKLTGGESLVIKDANDPETKMSFMLKRTFLGNEETDASDRWYYWIMCLPNGGAFGHFLHAYEEYLRLTDIQLMLKGLDLDGDEDFYLVKRRRSFKIDMPPIDDNDDTET